ncbi:uncharacterized protein LOC425455 isoform X3 [Gallus gallus]|uniref:uncharacterized protein LOC425455 isoform X3 n=1 Tax=Gallus gallus TaxID=9031 RepID=UPI001AE8047F|nr:uncharacterized protein LOC425455 isoform X3 [Gallus gallus]
MAAAAAGGRAVCERGLRAGICTEKSPDGAFGVPFPDGRLDPDFVPQGKPRGPLGQSTAWNRVPEPGVDAGGVTGGVGDPASPLRSRMRGSPSSHMEVRPGKALPSPQLFPVLEPRWNPRGPERGKDTSRRGRYSPRSSPGLKELLKEMEKAARGSDQPSAQDALRFGSHPTLPVSARGTQTAPTTGMPGVDAGKNTRAVLQEFLQVHFTLVITVLVTVLLSGLVMTCIAVSWMWHKYPVCKRAETAPGQAHPESDRERGQSGGEGRAELGEATEDAVVAQEKKNVSSGSSPFPSSFEAEFEQLCSKIRTDPSLWPTCPSSSPTDGVSSPDARGSRGSP